MSKFLQIFWKEHHDKCATKLIVLLLKTANSPVTLDGATIYNAAGVLPFGAQDLQEMNAMVRLYSKICTYQTINKVVFLVLHPN
jgi:hypothetical protein